MPAIPFPTVTLDGVVFEVCISNLSTNCSEMKLSVAPESINVKADLLLIADFMVNSCGLETEFSSETTFPNGLRGTRFPTLKVCLGLIQRC